MMSEPAPNDVVVAVGSSVVGSIVPPHSGLDAVVVALPSAGSSKSAAAPTSTILICLPFMNPVSEDTLFRIRVQNISVDIRFQLQITSRFPSVGRATRYETGAWSHTGRISISDMSRDVGGYRPRSYAGPCGPRRIGRPTDGRIRIRCARLLS